MQQSFGLASLAGYGHDNHGLSITKGLALWLRPRLTRRTPWQN